MTPIPAPLPPAELKGLASLLAPEAWREIAAEAAVLAGTDAAVTGATVLRSIRIGGGEGVVLTVHTASVEHDCASHDRDRLRVVPASAYRPAGALLGAPPFDLAALAPSRLYLVREATRLQECSGARFEVLVDVGLLAVGEAGVFVAMAAECLDDAGFGNLACTTDAECASRWLAGRSVVEAVL